MNTRFELFDNNIVSDIFGDEVVVVNLETGVYYSLRNTAAKIWELLQHSYSVNEITYKFIQIIENEDENETISNSIQSFVTELVEKNLIKPSTSSQSNSTQIELKSTTSFILPMIEQFTDMQDILLLDPVHDVDAQGWPITKDNS